MLANEIKLGQRVRVASNGLTALIVGRPEYYTPRAKLVRIKYENSTRYEYMIHTQLDLLPQKEQYVALGGEHVRQEGDL